QCALARLARPEPCLQSHPRAAQPGQFRARRVRGQRSGAGGVRGAAREGLAGQGDAQLWHPAGAAHLDRARGGNARCRRGAQGFRRQGSQRLMFKKLALVGIGLIGSSIARAARAHGLAETIAITTRRPETLAEAEALGLGDIYTLEAAGAVRNADLVILCTPVGAYGPVMADIREALMPGAILSDVGSVKGYVQKLLAPLVPRGV